MNTTDFVLVGTDFSPASDEAIRQASDWAGREGASLLICHALPQVIGSNPLFPDRSAHQQEALADLQRRVLDGIDRQVKTCTHRNPVAFEAVVTTGDPASALLRVAEERKVIGIVVGTTDSAAPGHTAERVIRYATCTVLMSKKMDHQGRVLVATDLSDPSLPAINAGIRSARERGAKLTLLHCLESPISPVVDGAMGMVWQPEFPDEIIMERRAAILGRLRRILEVAGAEGDIRCETGNPGATILRVAEEERSELLVLGSHGHSGWMRVLLGSVAEWVVRAAPTSLQVVRIGKDR